MGYSARQASVAGPPARYCGITIKQGKTSGKINCLPKVFVLNVFCWCVFWSQTKVWRMNWDHYHDLAEFLRIQAFDRIQIIRRVTADSVLKTPPSTYFIELQFECLPPFWIPFQSQAGTIIPPVCHYPGIMAQFTANGYLGSCKIVRDNSLYTCIKSKNDDDLLYLYLKKLITKGVSSFEESEQKSK